MLERATPVAATLSLALITWAATPVPSFAITGAGCPDLPEYYRALGTMQMGPGACNMTVEEAKRVLAREGQGVVDQAAPAPRKHHRRKIPRS